MNDKGVCRTAPATTGLLNTAKEQVWLMLYSKYLNSVQKQMYTQQNPYGVGGLGEMQNQHFTRNRVFHITEHPKYCKRCLPSKQYRQYLVYNKQ